MTQVFVTLSIGKSISTETKSWAIAQSSSGLNNKALWLNDVKNNIKSTANLEQASNSFLRPLADGANTTASSANKKWLIIILPKGNQYLLIEGTVRVRQYKYQTKRVTGCHPGEHHYILKTYQTVHRPIEYVRSGDHTNSTRGAEYK